MHTPHTLPSRRVLARRMYAAFAASMLLLGACSDPAASASRPKNLVLIALDTLRADQLGLYGQARPTSPWLDEFARDCFVFDEAQSVSSWTAPALVSVMTGLSPEVHDVLDAPVPGRLNAGIVTLAEILHERGYETAAFTEGGYAKGDFGLDQGFDLFPAHADDRAGEYSINAHASRIQSNVDRTIAWLQARGNEPYFLFFHTYEAHGPYRAPEELVRLFEAGYDETAEFARASAAIEAWNQHREVSGEDCLAIALVRLRGGARLPRMEDASGLQKKAAEHGLGSGKLATHPRIVERARNLFAAGVRSVDRELARLWAAIEAQGSAANTVTIVFSDHGEGLGDHGELEHGAVLNEEVLRTVLLARVHDAALPPRRIAGIASLLDVAPTALELLGIDPTGFRMQGHSLVAALRGAPIERTILQHGRTRERTLDRLFALRDAQYRLVFDEGSGAVQLFDHATDPGELVDVAAAHPEIVNRLLAELDRWRAQCRRLHQELPTRLEKRALDASTARDLHNLGYTGGDDEKKDD